MHSPPGGVRAARRRASRRRLAWLLSPVLVIAAVTVPASPSSAAPVGVAIPIQFQLTDNQGSWFDTGATLFGTKALGVAVTPRTKLLNLPLDTTTLLNTDLAEDLLDLPLLGGTAPLLGSLGLDLGGVLNLDQLNQAVDAAGGLLGFLNPTVQRAKSQINQLAQQVAGQPADSALPLSSLPVGLDLMRTLNEISNLAPRDLSLKPQAKFKVAAPQAASSHSVTSLIWPLGATPIDQSSAFIGDVTADLTEPGLYAWACKIHPYMLGAVVVDDPLTPGLDFGKKLNVAVKGGVVVPSSADIVQQLVQKFFRITAPDNWQVFSNTETKNWNPYYPTAPILQYDANEQPVLIPSLDSYYNSKFSEGVTLPALTQRPSTPGVGELWVDTQMEKYAGKSKSGAATKVDVQNWTVARKVALPQINLNNPHNMWSDKDGKYIYQTEWFSDRLTVFDRKTGQLIRTIQVGPDPSHVMTRTDTDQLHVAINAGNAVVELKPGATAIDRRILVQGPGQTPAHPHAHWMSADGQTMVTPNVNHHNSTIVDVATGSIQQVQTAQLPIATGMMPDTSKYYVANFLGQSVSCISLSGSSCRSDSGTDVAYKEINLWSNYDMVSGATSGAFGGLPIQLPVSPDGKYLLVANTLTSNITVIDTDTDKIVKTLPCDSGCHGINFGAKRGGGYYAYVSSKFSNALSIVDGDPNGDGNPADAAVVGRMVLNAGSGTIADDDVTAYNGMGGQGVLAYPIPYNGWVQNAPSDMADQLTCPQLNPINTGVCS
ncbi:copper oxidase [Luedemannella helvata]|uniref:YNCE-like beta-propeller domain-containing protein n=1 Tax=Luedemannella helvata TaxID=349315 RepID=A0ABP4VQ04_9ACTN